MTEREYREYPCDSYSTLKDFEADRKKYYKKYILKETTGVDDEQESRASLIGSLTDCLLLTPDDFDTKFHISSCENPPTGLMLQFVEALYKQTILACNEEGTLTKRFEVLLRQAYDDVKYDVNGNVVAFKRDSFEIVVGKFNDGARAYYDEILAIRPTNKILVTPNDLILAERLKTGLKTNFATNQIINLTTNSRFEVINQFMSMFNFMDMDFKCMSDKIVIDHEEKTIQPYDLKVTWNVENFIDNYYLYRKTYLQCSLYNVGITLYFKEIYPDYKVLPMKLIVADSLNYMNPLVYELTRDDLKAGYVGFKANGRNYRGLKSIINDLKWHKDSNIWNISKDNYDKRGKVNLNIQYE